MGVCVTGAGGFIGGWLVRSLLEQGVRVRAVDVKPRDQWWQHFDDADNMLLDLREDGCCRTAVEGMDRVYNLAADMGGIGYITSNKLDPMLSVLINTQLLRASAIAGVDRYLFTSSACVYGEGTDTREENAYPADSEDGYGWEKLFSERMCRHYHEEGGLETRVARLHNVYGPHGSWNDGREKAPAAICRKVATAIRNDSDAIEVWGTGEQTRSFMYVSDCVRGLEDIMAGPYPDPVNLGSSEMVTVNQLISRVWKTAGLEGLHLTYDRDAPRGVRGRNSDNTLFRKRYGWEPSVSLRDGLHQTYPWVAEQVNSVPSLA